MAPRSLLPRDRPRERLAQWGSEALATRELLAILVGSGGAAGSVFEIVDRLLGHFGGSLRKLGAASPGALLHVPGIGQATATRVAAALELGRRAAAEEAPSRPRIRGPEDVHSLMSPTLRDLPHEEFHALLLNTRHHLLRDVLITRGILDASLVHPREVFRPAIVEGAAAIILVHNHPSGDPEPSGEDRRVTQQMIRAGRALGIVVLDHVVIGDRRWASLIRRGGTSEEVPPLSVLGADPRVSYRDTS